MWLTDAQSEQPCPPVDTHRDTMLRLASMIEICIALVTFGMFFMFLGE